MRRVFLSFFVAFSFFRFDRESTLPPQAGNASRWAVDENNSKKMGAMVVLNCFPKNKDRFLRLIEFFKEVLDICNDLGILPVLIGSLAVFAYTENEEMNVNDIDLACSESEFPKIISRLEERSISYKLKEWHVIQILKGDLKVELDSIEYWYKDLSMICETLQIDNHKIKMLGLQSLREFYRQGMIDRADKIEENEKIKYETLKRKYEALEKVKD